MRLSISADLSPDKTLLGSSLCKPRSPIIDLASPKIRYDLSSSCRVGGLAIVQTVSIKKPWMISVVLDPLPGISKHSLLTISASCCETLECVSEKWAATAQMTVRRKGDRWATRSGLWKAGLRMGKRLWRFRK